MGIDILAQLTLWEYTFWHRRHDGNRHFGTVDIMEINILAPTLDLY